jgi:hypothetical protein
MASVIVGATSMEAPLRKSRFRTKQRQNGPSRQARGREPCSGPPTGAGETDALPNP